MLDAEATQVAEVVGAAILPGHDMVDTRSPPATARHGAPVSVATQAGSTQPAPPSEGVERVRQFRTGGGGGSGLGTGIGGGGSVIGGGSEGSGGGTGGVPGGGVGCGAWACIALSLAMATETSIRGGCTASSGLRCNQRRR